MKTKIIIAGTGGVGGYFGGLLAKHYENNDHVDICFIARDSHLKEIQTHGLRVIHGDSEFTTRPALATNRPAEAGIADFVIIATKSFDLEKTIYQLRPCIGPDTIILPLLNGVDSRERIKKIFPDNIVLDGCAYIVSRRTKPGVIENRGNIQKIYFGLDNFIDGRLSLLERLLKDADIDATLANDISLIIWEKYVFISATATATSYFDNSIGGVLADPKKLEVVIALIEEVRQIAKAKQITLATDITGKILNTLKSLPFEATSSLHDDFKNKSPQNELETLTGYVVREGERLDIKTPIYLRTYSVLLGKKV